jgi:glucosamine--fructose-6-phosphate aminotransferase (isomerizing)
MINALEEILEIPQRAKDLWMNSPSYVLPLKVPYLGMGSSYFAPLAFKYMCIEIYPEIASEYFNYLKGTQKRKNAVILSQSGKSTEALWCLDLFEQYTAITNTPGSPLATAANATKVISMMAGEELYSSSKTYTNTLLALFKGFGIDASEALRRISENMNFYQHVGEGLAQEVFNLLQSEPIHGIYITGSGPNISTAFEAGLILSESTKRNFNGLPVAQYDHGPKETAKNSIVIQILAKGNSYDRAIKLSDKIRSAGAYVFHVEEPAVSENLSILPNIIPFNFMALHLANKLNVGETFSVGGKVTEVE